MNPTELTLTGDDGKTYELSMSVIGGSLIILQSGALRGTLSLQDAPAPTSPRVLTEG